MTDIGARKLRVFLCHSSFDKPAVRDLYQRLIAKSWVTPWLDEEELLPGQSWMEEIERAVEAADAVIVCLSKKSVGKEGNLQKELGYALNIALEKPLRTSFLILVRFDACDIPRNLKNSLYIDFFPNRNHKSAFETLSQNLAVRAKEFGINLPQVISLPSLSNVTAGILIGHETPRVFISYSREDVDFVKNLAIDLQMVGLEVWWDISGLRGGDNWVRTIQDALDRSKYCIVVVTPNSIMSTWVEKEYTYAINNDKIVIPLFLVDCKMPFSFSNTQYVDFREIRYRTAMRELYAALDVKAGG